MRYLLVIATLISFNWYTIAQSSDLQELKTNWKAYLINQQLKEDQKSYFFTNVNGTWSDLDYNNRQPGNWPLLAHLKRASIMAKAYHKADSEYYHNPTLLKNILESYNWWVDNTPKNSNWWYAQIGIPQNLGVIMLLMEDNMDPKQWKKGIEIMDKVRFGIQTGQNLVWVSSNIVLRSILKNNVEELNQAAENIKNEMQIAINSEGLQPDFSFHQHGRQLQFGNYGLHFLEDQVKWMYILKNTAYEYTSEQIDLMRHYFSEGQRWVIWKGVYDINCSGRQLFPDEQLDKSEKVKQAALEMKEIDTEYPSLYKSISHKNNIRGLKFFPFSELLIQRTKQYMASIRMCSSRVKGSESGNGENLSGYYLADGAMCIMKTGEEYLNIFPYWDWRKIPGTTTVQDTTKLPEIGWGSYHIKSDFVGGFTYKDFGVSSMQYRRDGVEASKSYFIFPDFVVCLGSGISGKSEQFLQTNIEQRFSTTPFSKLVDNKFEKNNAKNSIKPSNCIWHENTGYIINPTNSIEAKIEQREAKWDQVVVWPQKPQEKRNVFQLVINHGINCKDDFYSYVIFPEIKKSSLKKEYKRPSYYILTNNKFTQAVQLKNATSIVFYKPGNVRINGTYNISINVPSLVFFEVNKETSTVLITDPTQKLESAIITLTKHIESDIQTVTKTINFPKGTKQGTPVKIEFQIK
ncbi:polysaccharide lyase family 8 super-sandwich domain-containing protein [Aestuariibaculum sediminum]|uniref:Chondroitin AC lyase n=1 Tax=Aestuariibaculum sediminum TaxID=2770637 RepID=A0A8J6PZZ0_9FLAO|nr:polysaccharide lyase family 8 super-sandwich domain-containing protein [Aestuariibaculum sediminum]MBD0831982.1 hypothetical protein [Aestuariibaculum sediminum]